MNKHEVSANFFLNPDIWSAGGVVFRTINKNIEVLICERFSENLVALPKGKPNLGEDEKATALREVMEETGIKVEIKVKIKDIFYSFKNNNKNVNKKVTFYLMEEISGDTSNHDAEFDKVYWEQSGPALKKLTYPGEKDVLEEAIKLAKSF